MQNGELATAGHGEQIVNNPSIGRDSVMREAFAGMFGPKIASGGVEARICPELGREVKAGTSPL